jgi:hypothetical protein
MGDFHHHLAELRSNRIVHFFPRVPLFFRLVAQNRLQIRLLPPRGFEPAIEIQSSN